MLFEFFYLLSTLLNDVNAMQYHREFRGEMNALNWASHSPRIRAVKKTCGLSINNGFWTIVANPSIPTMSDSSTAVNFFFTDNDFMMYSLSPSGKYLTKISFSVSGNPCPQERSQSPQTKVKQDDLGEAVKEMLHFRMQKSHEDREDIPMVPPHKKVVVSIHYCFVTPVVSSSSFYNEPDVYNLATFTLDALCGVIYVDGNQIYTMQCTKSYGAKNVGRTTFFLDVLDGSYV